MTVMYKVSVYSIDYKGVLRMILNLKLGRKIRNVEMGQNIHLVVFV